MFDKTDSHLFGNCIRTHWLAGSPSVCVCVCESTNNAADRMEIVYKIMLVNVRWQKEGLVQAADAAAATTTDETHKMPFNQKGKTSEWFLLRFYFFSSPSS